MSPLTSPTNTVLDALITTMALKNDAALARRLDMTPSAISHMRHGNLKPGSMFLLKAHLESDIPISRLKELAGLPAFVRRSE